MPNKRALLIGINQYPKFPPLAQLRGCVNDVALMKRMLESSLRFPPESIATLIDEQAVKQSILDALERLVEDCGEDDIVVFHYSGHGSSAPARKRDKPSGRDETIVPYDSGRRLADFPEQAENRDISDRQIHEWLSRLGRKTRRITLVFDSCHSGSITRLRAAVDATTGGTRLRWVPPDFPPEDSGPHASARGLGREVGSGWLPLSDRHVLLAACAENEGAFELDAQEDGAAQRYGAFTYFLVREFTQAPKQSTYRDVWERVAVRVANRFQGQQNPQLEGARDRLLFDVKDAAPAHYLLVTGREGDEVTLDGGAIHGLAVGSELEVYEAGTTQLTAGESALGKVSVTSAGAVSAKAKVQSGDRAAAIKPGARAVEVSRPDSEARMPLFLAAAPDGYEPQVDALRRELTASEMLEVKGSAAEARAEIRLLTAGAPDWELVREARGGEPERPVWAVFGHTDKTLWMSPRDVGADESAAMIREGLETIWRYEKTQELSNPRSALSGLVDFDLFRQDGEGAWQKVGAEEGQGDPVFEDGERIGFTVKNRSAGPVYVSVLDFGLSRRIDVLYPADRGSELIAAARSADDEQGGRGGGTLRVGMDGQARVTLSFPEQLTFITAPAGGGPPLGREVFKLVVTTKPHDLWFLRQRGLRKNPEPAVALTHPLERYAYLSASGGLQREAQLSLSAQDEWLTVERAFWLRRKA